MRVRDWAMVKLHKGYSIPSSAGVTHKLTQQYIGSFRVLQNIERLVYKLNVFLDWKVRFVFLVAQVELAPPPTNDFFHLLCFYIPSTVFVDGDTDVAKFFEVNCLLNKQIVKKDKDCTVKYLICWTEYRSGWDR